MCHRWARNYARTSATGIAGVGDRSAIKIRQDYIEAIEAGNFLLLPAGAYRKNFVRQYAHALGLNEDAALATFQEEHQEPLVALPAPVPSRPSHGLRMAGALAALSGSFFIYHKVVSETTSESRIARNRPDRSIWPRGASRQVPAYTRPAASQGEAARSDPRKYRPAGACRVQRHRKSLDLGEVRWRRSLYRNPGGPEVTRLRSVHAGDGAGRECRWPVDPVERKARRPAWRAR